MCTRLTIYTMTHCPTWDLSQRMVAQIRGRFPELIVEVVDLEEASEQPPPEVFSVPTYVLNGSVISLGNPYFEQLEASIRKQLRTG